jgi:hypothetical protein
MKEILQTNFTMKSKYQIVPLVKLFTDVKLLAECYSRCCELDNVSLFLKKVFQSESRDAILLRGEGCNTPGVYHQLSSGFKLKHDRLVEMMMPKSNL